MWIQWFKKYSIQMYTCKIQCSQQMGFPIKLKDFKNFSKTTYEYNHGWFSYYIFYILYLHNSLSRSSLIKPPISQYFAKDRFPDYFKLTEGTFKTEQTHCKLNCQATLMAWRDSLMPCNRWEQYFVFAKW